MSEKKPSLLDMPIGKALLVLSIPVVITNMLQVAYQFTDSFWVGRLGAEAVATTTLAGTIIFLTISLGSGFSIAGSILIAQYYGAKNKQMVNHVAAQTLLMIIITSIVFGALGYIFTPQILNAMGVEPSIYADTLRYVRVSFLGLVFNFAFFMFQAIMRGIGQANLPIYIVLFTVLLNFALDPLFIYGYGSFEGFGVTGAAIATVFTQSIASAIGFYILFNGKFDIHTTLKDYVPDMPIIKKSFFLGLPSSIEMTARSGSYALLTAIVGMFGTLALAGFGVSGNIIQFVVIFAMGLSMATSILVGQSIGAGQIEKAKKINFISSIVSFVLMTALGIISFFFGEYFIRFFVPHDLPVIELGTHILQITSLFFGLIGIQMSLNGVLRAIGKTQIPMYITILGQIVLKLPIAYYLAHYTSLGMTGIWWAEPITSVIICLIMFVIMLKVDWSKTNLTRQPHKEQEKKVIEESMIEEPIKEY